MSDKMLDRVQKLLNQAVGATTEAEREAFQDKANVLMLQHRISEAMLAASGAHPNQQAGRNHLPIHKEFEFVPSWEDFYELLCETASYLARLASVRLVYGAGKINVFGYEADTAYWHMLWTSAHLTFAGKIHPEWDKGQTDGANIKLMAEAGIRWADIHFKAQRAGRLLDVATPPADNGKMKRLYRAELRSLGLEYQGLTQSNRRYRESYAVGFADTIGSRVVRMMDAMRGEVDMHAIVLKKDADAIEDLIRATFPSLGYAKGYRRSRNPEARGARLGQSAAQNVDLSGGQGGVAGRGAVPGIGG